MLLQVNNLSIEFIVENGIVRAVDGISFSLNEGETLGIVGESGCGKSVTAMTLMRLLPQPPAIIRTGEILFRGRDLLKLSKSEIRAIRGNELAMIFQEPMTSLNPVFTIGFQIAEAVIVHRPTWSDTQVRERVLFLLEKVGMSEPHRRYDNYPHELSGGMRQRVMIAMALSCDPKLLIADEPTTALDVTIQAQILELIQELQKDFGMAVMLITHDLGIVAESVDRVIVMYAGKIAEQVAVEQLFANPKHPYTRGLLASIPTSKQAKEVGKRTRLPGIPGSVPDLSRLPLGCRFQDRCTLVQNRCRVQEPPLEEKAPGHWASCFEVH